MANGVCGKLLHWLSINPGQLYLHGESYEIKGCLMPGGHGCHRDVQFLIRKTNCLNLTLKTRKPQGDVPVHDLVLSPSQPPGEERNTRHQGHSSKWPENHSEEGSNRTLDSQRPSGVTCVSRGSHLSTESASCFKFRTT